MIALWIYIGICLLWGFFALYKQRTSYSVKGTVLRQILVFIMNVVLFPAMVFVAIKQKHILHKHKWVYHDYVPYIDENTSHGAAYRKCETCNRKQTNW